MDEMTLGEYRRSLGLSMAEAAEICGMPLPTWWRIETGQRFGNGETWAKIRIALGISPKQAGYMLFNREGPKTKGKQICSKK